MGSLSLEFSVFGIVFSVLGSRVEGRGIDRVCVCLGSGFRMKLRVWTEADRMPSVLCQSEQPSRH